jgi:O-antigen ligase
MPHRLLSAVPRQGGMMTYLRTATLAVWMFTLLFRFWWISDWFALQQQFQEGANIRAYYYIGFGICFAAHLTLGLTAWFAVPFTVMSTWSGRLFTIFCVVAAVLSPLSASPRSSLVYAGATWSVYAIFALYWQSDYRITQRMTVFAGLVVMAWLYALLFKHGLIYGFGSAIGGINRNTTATAALGGMICCLLSPRKSIRWGAIGAAAIMAIIVSSRGSMLAAIVFFATYYAIYKGTTRAAFHALAALTLTGMVLAVVPPLYDLVVNDILHLHDKVRGLGSGFTGRWENWLHALETFWRRPVFGYGFRAATFGQSVSLGGTHSGYLKILAETGIVGFTLIVSAMVVEAIRRFRLALKFRGLSPQAAPGIDVVETTRVNALVCATLTMTMTLWIYEQLYLNLGSVASLVLFIMLNAPAYITTHGVTLRR